MSKHCMDCVIAKVNENETIHQDETERHTQLNC